VSLNREISNKDDEIKVIFHFIELLKTNNRENENESINSVTSVNLLNENKKSLFCFM
jgi:hypothetical protein